MHVVSVISCRGPKGAKLAFMDLAQRLSIPRAHSYRVTIQNSLEYVAVSHSRSLGLVGFFAGLKGVPSASTVYRLMENGKAIEYPGRRTS